MSTTSNCIEKQVKAFCGQIGADPLLVQGAGGNVSWKDDDVLWVKASGTWLVEAESKEIFVPVNLAHLQDGLAKKDFSVKPEVNSNSDLRPSIETLLHALMPHKVVAHLHAIEILAHLVQVNARQKIKSLVADSVKWIYIDYFKPGADLARAVSEELANRPDADVVFMGNHGVVIGGKSVNEVLTTLNKLTQKLEAPSFLSNSTFKLPIHQADFLARGYVLCTDMKVNQLSLKKEMINRLRNEWALYPDHIVYLGSEAIVINKNYKEIELDEVIRENPPYVFVIGDGVYESQAVTAAQKSQLRCYTDVVSRLSGWQRLSILNKNQISELLDWEAEKYRRFLS